MTRTASNIESNKDFTDFKVADISLAEWGKKRNINCRIRDARTYGIAREISY
jgi:hypothetical protein